MGLWSPLSRSAPTLENILNYQDVMGTGMYIPRATVAGGTRLEQDAYRRIPNLANYLLVLRCHRSPIESPESLVRALNPMTSRSLLPTERFGGTTELSQVVSKLCA